MQLTQIGKILELSLGAESLSNAEQELSLETEGLSFAEALETKYTLAETTEEDLLSNAFLVEEDEAKTEENPDPVLYLQQFLHLEDKHIAQSETEALPKLNDIANQNTAAADDNSVLIAQGAALPPEESEQSIALPDMTESVLTWDELMENTPKQTHTQLTPLKDRYPIKDIDKESPSLDTLEIPSLVKTEQSMKETTAQDGLGQEDAERLQTLGVSKVTSSNGLEEQNDTSIIKPSSTENLSAPKMTENNAGSRAQAPEFNVNTPVHHDDWGDEFNQRILWLGQQKIDKALLQLHPKDLGPVQVQIQMQDNQAYLQIQVTDALVQQRIQDSLPELKALLEMQGLGLGQASIDSQNRGQQGGEQSQSSTVDFDAATESAPSVSPARVLGVTRDGHVDTYA